MTVLREDLSKGPFRTDGHLIVSFPKSGRTWVSFALSSVGIDATTTHAGSSTNRREVGRPFGGIQHALRDLPLVFLHRNPIDTAVSMFHQINKRDFKRGSARWWRMLVPLLWKGALPPQDIDAFVLHSLYGVEKVCAFNSAWLAHVNARKDCLVLTYENLRSDPAAEYQRLIEFFRVDGATGADLAAAGDFERMRKSELSLQPTLLARGKPTDPQSLKVRRGKVAGYRDELRAETIAKCESILARYGLSSVEPGLT